METSLVIKAYLLEGGGGGWGEMEVCAPLLSH